MPSRAAPPLFDLERSSSNSGLSLSGQITQALISEIRRGRYQAGARLPGTRSLAEQWGVHRNTVVSAYEDLVAQGYARTSVGSGTYVSDELTSPQTRALRRGGSSGPYERPKARLRLMPSPPSSVWGDVPHDALPLVGGLPDLRHVPRDELARAYRTALRQAPQTLDYQNALVQPRFSEQLRCYLAENRGVVAAPEELLATRGSQHALHLVARVLARPGSVIVVERSGYPPAWEGFRLAGAELVPVSTDKQGLKTDELEKLCSQYDVAAVYTTPHHQYPTTVTLSGPRRFQLLALARRHDFLIIEDDYDHEYHFEGRPVLPVQTADEEGRVLLIGTLSKVLAPGLRLGFAIGQPALIEALGRHRTYIDRQGDHVTELALSYLLEEGTLQAHIRRMHRIYRQRREVLFDVLATELGSALSFARPSGGLAVWCRTAPGISSTAWARAARERGVLVQQAGPFFFDGRERPYLRVGYARLDEAQLVEAVGRLSRALDDLPRRAR